MLAEWHPAAQVCYHGFKVRIDCGACSTTSGRDLRLKGCWVPAVSWNYKAEYYWKLSSQLTPKIPWPSFSYRLSEGFRKLLLMNFPASGENISVVLEMIVNCEGRATGKSLCGFGVVHCMYLLISLREVQDLSERFSGLLFCIQPNWPWLWGQQIREVYSLFLKSIDVYSITGNGLFVHILVAVV